MVYYFFRQLSYVIILSKGCDLLDWHSNIKGRRENFVNFKWGDMDMGLMPHDFALQSKMLIYLELACIRFSSES